MSTNPSTPQSNNDTPDNTNSVIEFADPLPGETVREQWRRWRESDGTEASDSAKPKSDADGDGKEPLSRHLSLLGTAMMNLLDGRPATSDTDWSARPPDHRKRNLDAERAAAEILLAGLDRSLRQNEDSAMRNLLGHWNSHLADLSTAQEVEWHRILDGLTKSSATVASDRFPEPKL